MRRFVEAVFREGASIAIESRVRTNTMIKETSINASDRLSISTLGSKIAVESENDKADHA
jgi:hypothetical protein